MNNRSKTAAPAGPRRPRRAVRLPLKALALATVCALHALPAASHAQSIGALDVRSRMGEAFFAAVPVQTADGILDPHCIRVLPNPNAPEGAAALQAVRVRIGSADTVLIETAGSVASPVVGLRLEVGCEKSVARDFVVVDERPSPSERSAVARVDSAPGTAVGPGAGSTQSAPAGRPQRAKRAPVASPAAPQDLAPPAHAPAPSRMSAAAASASVSEAGGARRVAELRARSDDQAAALLALDDRLALLQRQAEALKLQLEQRLGVVPPGGSGQPAAATAVSAAAPSATSPAPSTMASAAPPAHSPLHSEASTGGASAAPIATAAASTNSSAVVSPVAASPLAVPQHAPRSALDLLSDWKVAGGLGALLLGALAFKLRRRPTFKDAPAAAAPERDWEGVAEDLLREHARTQPIPAMSAAAGHANGSPLGYRTSGVDQTAEWIAPPTTDSLPVPSAHDGGSPLPGGAMTRESHLAQKFQPDDAEHLVARAAPDEIVQQARTHYMEDADLFKAIDLLEMAVAARKDSVRPWQALFAIYRRENMPERFQRLANAYRKTFGTDESWSAILAFGRDIDPANPLYAAQAGSAPLPEDLVERWLGVPLDFTAHLLANEMHDELMDTTAGFKRGKRPTGE